MTRLGWPVGSAVAGFLTVGLIFVLAQQMHAPWLDAFAFDDVAGVSAPIASALPAVIVVARRPSPDAGYYDRIRAQLHWVQTRLGSETLVTPDYDSRVLLAKSAAKRAGLAAVGLSFRDVYGIINAETSWIPRLGASKDGTPNLGIAQFEPATAKALGIVNPNDPVEAIHAAALHMKEAALWSADRLAHLKLSAADRATRLRDGVSIYYNLSSRGRSAWNGRNTAQLPIETRRHIENARIGAQEAAWLDAQISARAADKDAHAVASLP